MLDFVAPRYRRSMTVDFNPLDIGAQEAAEAFDAEVKRLQRGQEVDDFKWLMAYKQGRRVMWRLLSISGVFRNPFSSSRELTDFNCGQQNVGQQLLMEIHTVCPEAYHTMTKEHQDYVRRLTDRINNRNR